MGTVQVSTATASQRAGTLLCPLPGPSRKGASLGLLLSFNLLVAFARATLTCKHPEVRKVGGLGVSWGRGVPLGTGAACSPHCAFLYLLVHAAITTHSQECSTWVRGAQVPGLATSCCVRRVYVPRGKAESQQR